MEPRQVLRERLIALTRLRIVQIQESANLNHNHVRGTVSRRLLVLRPQDLHKNLFQQLITTHLSTCRDVSNV
jgi:hypothetical protein